MIITRSPRYIIIWKRMNQAVSSKRLCDLIRELSICTTDGFCDGKTSPLRPHHDSCQVIIEWRGPMDDVFDACAYAHINEIGIPTVAELQSWNRKLSIRRFTPRQRNFSRIQQGSIVGLVTIERFWMDFMLSWRTTFVSQTPYICHWLLTCTTHQQYGSLSKSPSMFSLWTPANNYIQEQFRHEQKLHIK